MPEDTGAINALDWQALVEEAVRRRKAERMTQREHAALASVSIPTMIAFDRGERTLSLAKAFDILRVVGLVREPASGESAQEIFVTEAYARWRELTATLPKNSPGRFPHGWYRFDYALDGDIREVEPHKFIDVLRRAQVPHTGWRMFWLPRREELKAHEESGVVECWLAPGDKEGFDRPFYDAAHCDFWRAAPSGRAFLMRGYQEDAQETIPPGTIFDTTLPIWRVGEAFLHAAKLAALISRDLEQTTIRMRTLYTGLTGRDLRAWASPMSVDYFGGGRSRSDEALVEGTAPAASVEKNLVAAVYPLVSSVFERFGVTGISESFVDSELQRMRGHHYSEDASEAKG